MKSITVTNRNVRTETLNIAVMTGNKALATFAKTATIKQLNDNFLKLQAARISKKF